MTRSATLALFLVLGVAVSVTACEDDDDPDVIVDGGDGDAGDAAVGDADVGDAAEPTQDIVEVATSMPDTFSSLVAALQRAELVDELQGDGPFTVFAPTDDAFQALLDGNEEWDDVEDIPEDTLTAVLTYHVIEGAEVSSSDVEALDPPVADTVSGLTLWFETDDGVAVNDASVVTPDVLATNGVIHVIDEVLLPPSAADFAEIADLTELVTAVGAAAEIEPGTTVADVLDDDEATLTVFAPTDEAFGDVDTGSLTDEQIRDVLLYHVIEGSAVDSESIPGSATTALGDDLTFDTSGEAVVVNPDDESANVTIPDIMVTNGIVHVIDAVLLPEL
ncbi:MAG: fasciclin domain-containing protein [Myxococcota bacterium]